MMTIRVHQGRTAEQEPKNIFYGTSASLDTFSGNHLLSPVRNFGSRSMPAEDYTGKPTQVVVPHLTVHDVGSAGDPDAKYQGPPA